MKQIQYYAAIIIIIANIIPNASAQRRSGSHQRGFDYELRGGLNFCQIDGDASGGYSKIGYHAGVATSMPLNDEGRIRFQVGVGLTQKGSHISNNSLDRHISLLYVEVPLMLVYDFMESRNIRLGVGMAPAILAKANVTTYGSYDQLQSDNYKNLDLLPLCLSLRYRITEHLAVDLRGNSSMLNIAIENGSGTYRILRSNKGQFNHLFQLGITYCM